MDNIISRILMGMGCLALLWLGSCTLMGVGGAMIVREATSDENLERLGREADERETKRHNEQMNDEAGYGADRYGEPGVSE